MTRQSDIEETREMVKALYIWFEKANAIVGQAITKAKISLDALKDEFAGRGKPAHRR